MATQAYKVKRGDTLSEIARDHGTTVDAIMKANPAITNADRILEGQDINLPSGAAPPGRREGDDGFTYTVKQGDSLYKIAREQYGSHHSDANLRELVDMLVRENNLRDPDRLDVGQQLWLPRAE